MSAARERGESARAFEPSSLRHCVGAALIGLGALAAAWAALSAAPLRQSPPEVRSAPITSGRVSEGEFAATVHPLRPQVLDLGTFVVGDRDASGASPDRACTMPVTNHASSARRIVDVRTSCGCVVVDPAAALRADSAPIAAGDHRPLDLTVRLADAGPFRATVWVRWDDGAIDAHMLHAHVARADATVTISDRIVDDRRIVVVVATRDGPDPPPSPPAEAIGGAAPAFFIGPWNPLGRPRDSGLPERDPRRQWICEFHLPRADGTDRPTTVPGRRSS